MDAALARLQDLVLDDPAIQHRLLGITDRAAFCQALSALADDHGETLSPADVEAALDAARRDWSARWV